VRRRASTAGIAWLLLSSLTAAPRRSGPERTRCSKALCTGSVPGEVSTRLVQSHPGQDHRYSARWR
jgi:hypothetical protein